MNYPVKKIFLSFFLFSTFTPFGGDTQTEENTMPEKAFEELKTEAMETEILKRVLKQVISRDPKIIKIIGCVYIKDIVGMVGIVDIDSNVMYDECKGICQNIYSQPASRKQCEKLPLDEIEKVDRVHSLLESPPSLETIFSQFGKEDLFDSLGIYLGISTSPFDKLTSMYNRKETETILNWLLEDDMMSFFIEADGGNKTLNAFFREIFRDFDLSVETHRPFVEVKFKTNISGEELGFMEELIEHDLKLPLNWFHNYIIEKSEACSENGVSLDCFTVFCKIGKDMKEKLQEGWVLWQYDGDAFREYIDNIIKAKINAPQWSVNDDFKDVDDVNNFYTELCGDLAE